MGAVVELAVATINLVIEIISTAIMGMVLAVTDLARPTTGDDGQVSSKRLANAFTTSLLGLFPLAAVVIIFIGMIVCFACLVGDQFSNETRTAKIIKSNLLQLKNQIDSEGHFIQQPADRLEVTDAWGNRLRVKYESNLAYQFVIIKSDGADSVPETDDDLIYSEKIARPKKEIAMEMLGKARNAMKSRWFHEDEGDN
ncbi:MAG: hypothetical protein AAGA30_15890 [Planctomycetota bacterium]